MDLNRFHLQSLQTRITILTLFVFLSGLWLLAAFSNHILHRDMERVLSDQQFSIATLLANEIDREFDNRVNWLNKLASTFSEPLKQRPAELQALIEQRPILHELFNNGVFVTGLDGQLLAQHPLSSAEQPANAIDSAVVAETIKTGKPGFGVPTASARFEALVLTMAVPIQDDSGETIGTIGGIINLGKPNFIDQVAKTNYGLKGGFALLTPQNRTLIAATDKSRIMEKLPAPGSIPMLDRALNGDEGSAIFTTSKGVETLGSAKGVPIPGWVLVVTLPTQEAFLPIHSIRAVALLALVFMTLLIGSLIWWVLKRQLDPLLRTAQRLTEMAERSNVDLPTEALPVNSNDEVGQVITGFNRLLHAMAEQTASLAESRALINTILENVPLMIFLKEAESLRFVMFNKAGEELIGHDRKNLLGKNDLDFFPPEQATQFMSMDRKVLNGELKLLDIPEEQVSTANKGVRVLHTRKFCIHSADGASKYLLGISEDITERKEAGEALIKYQAHLEYLVKERTQQYETILNNALVGIVYVKNERIVSSNRRFNELFQYQSNELIGESIERFFPTTEQFPVINKLASQVIKTQNTYHNQMKLKRKDGSLFWGEINGRAIDQNNPGNGSIWIIADISERQRIEEESARLLRAVEQSPVSIAITDREGVIEYVNPFFTKITGYSASETIGQTPRVLKSDETPYSVYEDLWRTILVSDIWRGTLHNRCKDGHLIWERTSISPIFNISGEISHFVAVKEDVTEQRRIEQQLEEHQEHLEELVQERTIELKQALEAAKIADRTKDEFLANITHDLRTPLNAVIGFTSLARPLSTNSTLSEYLNKIDSAGHTLIGLVNDLLDLSKIAAGRMELDPQAFSLRQLLSDCLATISYKAREKGLLLSRQIDERIPDVLIGDSLRIEQIILNLLSNAVKFTPSGQVSLRVSHVSSLETSESVFLTIEVKDSGIGMSNAVMSGLFKPFRQGDASMTRRFGGTGLGLVICQRLITLMNGEISVSSEEHRGSLFSVTLPLRLGACPLPVVAENTQDASDIRYEGVKILVADDQPLNRDLVQGILEIVGIRPNFARNDQEAVDILKHSTESYDLVLMDIQMPTMDGLTATRLIREHPRFAQLPIIALTAHTMLHEKEVCQQAGMNDHIGKPFTENEFFKVLAKWISSSKQRKQNKKEAPALPQKSAASLPYITGIDMAEGLALMQGDETRYRHWLEVFSQQAPMLIARVRQTLLAGETEQASMAAHTLKGNSGLLGMKELHAAATRLEIAINQTQAASELIDALDQSIRTVCAEIVEKLGLERNTTSSVNSSSPEKHAIPAGEKPDCIIRLIASLNQGDGDCDHYVEQCLEELANTAWIPHLKAAQEAILNFNFSAASQLLYSDSKG